MENDSISKQLVIDIIEQHKKIVLGEREWHEGIAYGYAMAHRHLADIFKQLPSAQPEIVRCVDCKHRNAENGFCEGRGWPMQLVPDDGFCDKGERSEE